MYSFWSASLFINSLINSKRKDVFIIINLKKISQSAILVAVSIVCSTFYIPLGIAKVFPVQHFINVLAGVTLGPIYAVSMAFITSLIRNMIGTGSLLAFPGSMCGAFLCAILYKYTKKKVLAFVGEVVGTGLIGAIFAYLIAILFMSKEAAIFTFVIPFGISTLVGASISLIFVKAIDKLGLLKKLKTEEK